MNEQEKPPLRTYMIEPAPAPEPAAHEHIFRIATGGKNVVRYCEKCGQTWLMTVLSDMIHPSHQVYCWAEILEADAAHEKLFGMSAMLTERPE